MALPILTRLRSFVTGRPAVRDSGIGRESVYPLSDNSPHRQTLVQHVGLSAITDVGRCRSSNQDSFRVIADKQLFIVADGMGGERCGDIASSLAVEGFVDASAETEGSSRLLRSGFNKAQDKVLERGKIEPSCSGMGAAVVAAALDSDDIVHVGHLGDARAYVLNDNGFRRLTIDHSTIARCVLRGQLSWEEARRHPGKNTLYRAVGIEGAVVPDLTSLRLFPGDRLLLCSDGLWDELSDSEIEGVLRSDGSVSDLTEILINRALAAGGHDNVTVLLYEHLLHNRRQTPRTKHY